VPVALRPIVAAALLGAAVPQSLGAAVYQCPDGTPPPCAQIARPPARESPRAPDPNRIAVLPFRVTTADTLLGEGFAELLATEFTGEGSPRSVDMATVLSAWRRAGGGLRTPLPRAEAVRVARELGAGLVSEGSIVGLGGRVTVTASLVRVPDGLVRGSPTRVSGSPDSLDALLRQTATGLLATVGGQQRSAEGARFTESPLAMRYYLEGLSAWRRGRLGGAANAFDRAIAEDSSFTHALFRRYMASTWGVAGGGATYARLAWDRRDRLGPWERTVLEGLLGPRYPDPRLAQEQLADRQRAVARAPDSPEALYILGDYYYHYASPIEPANQLQLAKEYLERSAAIDSQATVLRHLIEIGVRTRDTTLLRRAWPALDRTEDPGRWMGGWLVAATTGDQALLGALRRRAPASAPENVGAAWGLSTAVGADITAPLLDEMMSRWDSAIGESPARAFVRMVGGGLLALRGRPEAAQRLWSRDPSAQVAVDQLIVRLAMAGSGSGLDVDRSASRLAAARGDSATEATSACLAALWRAQRGDTSSLDVQRFRRFDRRCGWAIELLRSQALGAPDPVRHLEAADSALRHSLAFDVAGYEGLLLARAWEARGQPARALAAIRLRAFGAGYSEGCCWREEGRLAAVVGDTAGAIRAYRTYLIMHQDAEAILIPQRDSVRAELVRLERR
jgi:tetratricopeptide (TPR) repeat protein/TolB-like protein